MKAIILAAGYGGRMRPLTDNCHKTLLEISGQSIIDRMINALIEVNVKEIIVATGYRHDELVSHLLRNHKSIDFKFVRNARYGETNNIYSLALVLDSELIDDDVILIESDLIFKPATLTKLVESDYKNVAMVDRYRTGMDGTVVKVNKDIVTEVIPPHLQSADFKFDDKFKTLNIYKFGKDFINGNFSKIIQYYAKTIDDNCYYELILGLLIYLQQDGINALLVDQDSWAEVDDPNDLSSAEYTFDKSARRKILDNAFGGMWSYDVLDFCFIRNMHFPTPSMVSELKANLENLIHNYGSKQFILNSKLSYALQCETVYLQLLNGASQVYPVLQNFLKTKKVLIPNPTFGEYDRIFPNAINYNDRIGIDLAELNEKISTAEVVVFVNPNNPTGTILATEYIYNKAKENTNKIFIVDESFIDFSEQKSIISYLDSDPLENVLVITSLSKSWGVPGVRLGYVYTQNELLLNEIKQKTSIWNANSIAEFYLEMFLKHRTAYEVSLVKTKLDRQEFVSLLNSLTIIENVFPSEADFVLVKLLGSSSLADRVTSSLLESDNIYVKDVSSKINDGFGYLRLAVRTKNDHRKLIRAIENLGLN